MLNRNLLIAALLSCLGTSNIVQAAVSPEEAAQLKSTLTPLGAEKAGNKDGTIPAWDGAYSKPVPVIGAGKYGDPFSSEKPVVQITAQNAAQYAARLTEGAQALLKKYPSFRIDVYPTHRTAGAPQWVYDNTFKAATSAKLISNGLDFEGAWGGVPFPIPKSGNEVMLNHIMRPTLPATDLTYQHFVGSSDGKRTVAAKGELQELFSYYQKSGSAKKYDNNYEYTRYNTNAPSFKAGEAGVIYSSNDVTHDPQAWQYLVGQRRIRRAPTVGYDTPDFVASGTNYFDEIYGFMGRLDRYNWKLVGKQEVYIPYNNNRFFAAGEEKAFVPYHTNPDAVRWELHRVWVVEATLASGKRHAVPKRRFYVDEDSWAVVLADGYDAEGKLWRTSYTLNELVPDSNGVFADHSGVVYSLQANTFSAFQYLDSLKVVSARPLSYWSPDALSDDSAR